MKRNNKIWFLALGLLTAGGGSFPITSGNFYSSRDFILGGGQ